MPKQSDVSSTPRLRLRWPNGVVAPNRRMMLWSILWPGERVLWTGAPNTQATLRTQIALWWVGVPWTLAAVTLHVLGLIPWNLDFFAIVLGVVFLAAPFLLVFQADGTIYAITGRRALVRHDALGKMEIVSVPFEDTDEAFEIVETGKGTGHLYFASGLSTKLSYVDFDGKYAFRELKDPQAIKALFERIRAHWKANS
jgi:hypothetical protein